MRKTFASLAGTVLACSTVILPGCQEDRGGDGATDNTSNRSATMSERSGVTPTEPGGVGSGATAGVNAAGERTTDSTGAAGPRTGEAATGSRGYTGSPSSAAQRPISGAGSGTLDGRGVNEGQRARDAGTEGSGADAIRGGTGAGQDSNVGTGSNATGNDTTGGGSTGTSSGGASGSSSGSSSGGGASGGSGGGGR
jgi:hypothetical protein